MLKIRKMFVVAAIFAFFVSLPEASAQSANPQTVFNIEDEIEKKVVIPEAVIAILKSDRIVDGCFERKGANAKEGEWFAASEIDLNGDGRADLIVKAADACLFGANQAPFWIFQNAPDGYQKVLAASGLQLVILPVKSNSFNQIKISKVVAMKPRGEIYGFRAGKYTVSKRDR